MPLFDIFKTRKKQDKKQIKPLIIIDIHEKNSSVIANLAELGAEIEEKNLEIGDYLVGETIIERKTFSDFISSMLSKRLVEQLKNMQKYNSRLLILEGKDFESLEKSESKLNPNTIRGMLLSISLDWNTSIISTKDSEETAKYLFLLAKRQLKTVQEISLHSRIPKTKKEQKQYIIESFQGIGPKTAKKLLKKFGTIKNIINVRQEELEQEIGKKAEIFKIVEE